MDGDLVLEGIDNVLVPHLQQCNPQTEVVLILDHYVAHTSEAIIQCLVQLGITLYIVPGGCTYICQPFDVRINKPFRDRLRRNWMEWVVNEQQEMLIPKNYTGTCFPHGSTKCGKQSWNSLCTIVGARPTFVILRSRSRRTLITIANYLFFSQQQKVIFNCFQ